MSSLSDDLEFAHRLADLAGAIALDHFERGVVARTKPDGTALTDADLAVEQAMRQHLEAHRPHDGIHGEEFGASGPVVEDGQGRVWLIDPIDGTSFFAAHNPHWRVHVALQIGGETVVSVVAAPALRLRWWATVGGGAFEAEWSSAGRGRPKELSVSSTGRVDGARVAVFPEVAMPLVSERCQVVQASSLHMVDVVRGILDGYVVACCHAWDHAPWILLVEEAGGRFTDWTGGRDPARGGGIFSNPAIHGELVVAGGAIGPPD